MTQPWVLVVLGMLPFLKNLNELEKKWLLLSIPTFFLFFWMNASFIAWHGGACPGPRYLAPILPAFGPLVAIFWNRLRPSLKFLLWLGMAYSIFIFILVQKSGVIVGEEKSLWYYLWIQK